MLPTHLSGTAVRLPDAATLSELLHVERLDADVFRSVATTPDPQGLYGGQVMGQALRAASATVGPRYLAHSLHAYFVRPGDPTVPVIYRITVTRTGRSYAARHVRAVQGGDVLLDLACSFHVPEAGQDRQAAGSPVAAGHDPRTSAHVRTRAMGVEFRDAEPGSQLPSPTRVWARVPDEVDEHDPHLRACMVTYLSDMCSGVFTVADFDWNVQLTSLDHALWLYRPVPEGWLLMDLAGESVAHGRGHYRGRIFDESGALVAGLAQESLFRAIPHARPHTIIRGQEEPWTPTS